MAATNRLFVDFISGVTDAALTSGDTTISGPFLADLPEVADPDFIALILDPEFEGGDAEIVWVTAHTASATTATIERGKEGSSARAHDSGIKVVAALTADAIEELEAATASHAARHLPGGEDVLEVDKFFRTGGDESGTDSSTSTSFVDKVTVAFTLPANWAGARIVAWGQAAVTIEAAANNSNAGEARIEIGGSNGTALRSAIVFGSPSSPNTQEIPLPMVRHQTDVTGNVTIALAVRHINAQGSGTFRAGSLQCIAYRIS